MKDIASLSGQLYEERGQEVAERIAQLIQSYRGKVRRPPTYAEGNFPLGPDDAVLIAYGDSFQGPDGSPLSYLHRFLAEEMDGLLGGVHILPFSPWSSDDGFSVIDYRKVAQDLGTWEDIERIAAEFHLMADLVLNHCSQESPWFQAFLRNEEPYSRYFITVAPGTDTSMVFRPRALPLLNEFQTASGPALVWTTFSRDQVDLNFAEPDVMLEMLDVLLGYVSRGAGLIRLDAIAYLWKELGTPCIHHPRTHAAVQLMRAVLEEVAPWVIIITETNVPHRENVSYFGDGSNEAHMVYNFSLPPLVLDAFLREDASTLCAWADSLEDPGPRASYFNFCASHDGIGVLPARGILPDQQIDAMIQAVLDRGGRVSYKATADGEVPYELNVSYLSAIANPALPDEQRARTFLASQSILLAFRGIPALYYHSVVGSQNWEEGVQETGRNRSINRKKLRYEDLVVELHATQTIRGLVFQGIRRMLAARQGLNAFHPTAPQDILEGNPGVAAILRRPKAGTDGFPVLCLTSVSSEETEFHFAGMHLDGGPAFRDLISGDRVLPTREGRDRFSIQLAPWEVLWLSPLSDNEMDEAADNENPESASVQEQSEFAD